MTLTIDLPLPPSANALFRNTTSGRAKTAAYRSWLERAGYAATLAWRAAGCPSFNPPIHLRLQLGLTDRRRDAGNCLKPIEDMLVKTITGLPDDRWNDRILIERDEEVPVGAARVTIASIAQPG